MLGDDIMQAIQAQPGTSAELADQFGVSDRHVRRILTTLPVTMTRKGRSIAYSPKKEEEKEAAASSSITAIADPAGNSGHGIADMSAINCGHLSASDEKIADIEKNSGHDSGHGKKETSKQRYRNRKQEAIRYGPAAIGPQFSPGTTPCTDGGSSLCPQFYAGFERDTIQFVLLDKIFRDLLVSRAGTEKWEIRESRGLIWIRPGRHMSLQVGKDTVTFYSDEPGDMSAIAQWVRESFTEEYKDIDSLVSRIKYPQDLSAEELTIVIRHQETIAAIRTSISKTAVNGQFNLQHPSEKIPGLKIYESGGTMRVELIVHNRSQALSGLDMRAELMGLMPRIHRTPGLFWEFVQKYYSALHHPIMIDTGGHEFLQALDKVTAAFTGTLNNLANRIPTAPLLPEESRLKEIEAAIEEFEIGVELDDILRAFQRTLKIEDRATKVYLAAWVVWTKRNCKGRVLKEEVSSLLQKAGDPLTLAEIADAIEELKKARLMDHDARLEIKFSPMGQALAKKLTAKREGVQ